ncbi:MAG TPA: MoxR family ATPase [Kofleriaceae bacterium]|nr:MoxR family ATPase [Kofleriaceae bacterium]
MNETASDLRQAPDARDIETVVDGFTTDLRRLRQEIGTMIVGQEDIVEGVIMAILGGGHALLEGVPGLGKTMLVRVLAECIHADFARIQFTPDLMPADIVGTNVIIEDDRGGKHFEFQRGPIFANIVLADEINRATPKTQSALLEAMQDSSVTVSKHTYKLDQPFFVLATQNPLEMEGTYPLPEAQLDRFFFKLKVEFPDRESLHTILDRTTSDEQPTPQPVLDKRRILEMKQLVRRVPLSRTVQDYAVRVLQASHPQGASATDLVKKFVRYGASPRGVQTAILGAKIRALLDSRYAVSIDDIRRVMKPALRHRILLSFEGEAEGIDPDKIIADIMERTPEAV